MIRDRSQELGTFYTQRFTERVGKRPASANGHHSEPTDEKVISLARSAKNSSKFEALWSGDTSGYASHSEAEQALISLLAFYTQDETQLDSLYRRSGLCREKWLKRSGYRRSTIDKALSNLTETYSPSNDGARMVVGNGHASLPSPSLYKDEGRGRKLKAVRFSDIEVLLGAYEMRLTPEVVNCDKGRQTVDVRVTKSWRGYVSPPIVKRKIGHCRVWYQTSAVAGGD